MSRAREQRLRARRALVTLIAFLHALVVAPALHAHHHAVHGDDHVHQAAGTEWHAHEHDAAGGVSAAHAELHEVFAALGLSDVATAGTLAVDCALADYTLVECTPGSDHAPAFGDAIVAHGHRARGGDPAHGQGALQHGHLLVLAPPVLAVLRACGLVAVLAPALVTGRGSVPTVLLHDPRGPPRGTRLHLT